MIDRKDVQHVAALARLSLSEIEIDLFTAQLGSILQYVEQLNKVDTENIVPTSFAALKRDPLRDDVFVPSLSREKLLHNGPRVKKDHFAVPKVIN